MSFFPVSVPGVLDLLEARNNTKVILSAAIDDVVTTIPVVDTSDIPDSGYLTFEDGSYECIHYTGKTINTLTGVTRGADGTTPAGHGSNSGIGMWQNAGYHNILSEEIRGVCQNLADRIGLSATQLLAIDGSAASPSYSFGNSPGLGMYFAGAGQLAFATAGAARLFITTAAISALLPFFQQDGIAASPVYSFAGDQDTGIYRIGADGLGITAGGTLRFQVSSTEVISFRQTTIEGSDFICKTGGNGRLTIRTTGSVTTLLSQLYDGSNYTSAIYDATQHIFRYLGNEGFRITNGGRCQIQDGTVASPALQFASDTDTGFYHHATLPDYLLVATGGEIAGGFLRSGAGLARFYINDGTESLPGLPFLGDGDTGIYRVTTNELGFAVGGLQRAKVTTAGLYVSRPEAGNMGLVQISGDNGTSDAGSGVVLAYNGILQWHMFQRNQVVGNVTAHALVFSTVANSIAGSKLAITQAGQVMFEDGTAASPSMTFRDDSDTGFFRVSSGVVAMTSDGVRAVQFGKVTAQDDVQQNNIRLDGGGGSTACFLQRYTTTGVTTTAKKIAAPGANAVLCIVCGNDGINYFRDLVMTGFANSPVTVISSSTETNSPAARTYSHPNLGEMFLAMASGTYSTSVFLISVGAR